MFEWIKAKLEANGRQIGKTEYIMAGLLGIIIVGALAMVIYSLFGNPNGAAGSAGGYYKCTACQNEFIPDPKDVRDLSSNPPSMFGGPPPRNCPKCNAHGSAWPMAVCHNCGKRYLSETKAMADPRTAAAQNMRDVCPYCKTDQIEWLKAHIKH